MGLSLQDRVALLPRQERADWLATLPDYLIEEMQRGEWWWVSRPEQVPPPGDWMICLALAGRGFGKLISLDTLIASAVPRQYGGLVLNKETQIPGRFGFRKMGEIQVGDWVLDEAGVPCRVTATSDAVPEIAYRVHFNDGTHIDACSEHQWVTWTILEKNSYLQSKDEVDQTRFPDDWPKWRALESGTRKVRIRNPNGKGPRVRTTQEIVDSLTYGARGRANHSIPVTGALVLPNVELPIDPWMLGYWLGNGTAKAGKISGHLDDIEHVREMVLKAGFSSQIKSSSRSYEQCFSGTPHGLVLQLRELRVLDNKHVPESYLWSSVEQRKALLAGLMDSDGGNAKSCVTFVSTARELAEAVVHLARSLGQKPIMTTNPGYLNGQRMRDQHRVTWRPTFNPFLSPRKSRGYIEPADRALRSYNRIICDVERIDPEPMRCLTVDSPNSMYLAGEGLIPTHNSRAGSEWIVNQALKHPYDSSGVPTEWLVIAETLSDARTICMEGPAGILRVLERRKIKHRYKMSPRPMVLFPSGAKIYTEGADDPDVGRGYTSSGGWLDEIAKWKYPKLSWESGIMPSLRADLVGDHPRAFITTTPKPIDILQDWVKRSDGTVHIIRGSTFDNSGNLSSLVISELRKRYDGTTIGRQELYGEMVEGFDGALFTRLDIENNRVDSVPDDIVYTVVGVDPSLTGEDDEMGIVVVARTRDNHMYVLADRSIMGVGRSAALETWRVVAEWGADMLICEVNLGKRWMQQVFNDAYYELVGTGLFEKNTKPPLKGIDTKIGKKLRGEPVAMRNEQGKLHHVGTFPELEDQMATFTSWGTGNSPDRLDAMVHACRYLIDGERKQARITSPQDALSTTLKSLWEQVGSYQTDF